MEEYKKLLNMLLDSRDDFEKFFDKGNKAAGTRVRKTLQSLVYESKDLRSKVTEIKNADKSK